MDELKVRSIWMKSIIAKGISKKIKKKSDCDLGLKIHKLEVHTDDDISHVSLAIDADMPKRDISKKIKQKSGCNLDLKIHKLEVHTDDNTSHASLVIDGDMPKRDLEKLLQRLGI